MKCRFCATGLKHVLIDLINAPASNSFLSEQALNEPELFFPLKIFTCHKCFLVQTEAYQKSDKIFDSDYAYFSSYSTTWLAHAKKYTEMMMERFGYDTSSLVVEIASNDGYLLQYFHNQHVPVLGVEPTANTAAAAKQKGIDSINDFFSIKLARGMVADGKKADLIIGNNVLAHVPDILDFVGGMKILLKERGVITMEFPHLMQLIDNNQFDTIYHEHFSYLCLYTVKQIFESLGLQLFDVDEIPTHGGSLRIYAKHLNDDTKTISKKVDLVLQKEIQKGLNTLAYYDDFKKRVLDIKMDFTLFLIKLKREGKSIAGYGAAAKGNTLLNYCGVKADMIDFVVDANPHKQGKFLPGSHIPVVNEQHLKDNKPDFVVIFPWNLKAEIMKQLEYINDWGGKFIIPIPGLNVECKATVT